MIDHTPDLPPGAERPFKDGESSFGSFYPKHYVLAVYPDDATAGQAGDALRAAGFAADDVAVVSGAELAGHAQAVKAGQGAFTRLREQWSRLYTDAWAVSKGLVELAEQGHAYVFAYAPEDAEMVRAVNTIRPLGPKVLLYFGTFTVTDLT